MSDNNQSIQEAEEDDDRMQNQHQHQKKKRRKRRRKKKSDEEEEEEEEKKKKGGVKNLILVPFRKFEKLCTTRKQRSTRLPPSQSPSPEEEEDFLLGKGCHPHLCFSHPRVALDSPTRPDPDVKPSSYHDFLRSMIEKNDFYSPECNVHI